MNGNQIHPVTVTFANKFFAARFGMSFSEDAYADPITRTERDRELRRALYDKFGDVGVGERDPKPAPNLEAYGHRFMPALLGCDIIYNRDQAAAAVPLPDAWEAMERLTVPDLDQNPVIRRARAEARALLAKYGAVDGAINAGSALNVAVAVFGQAFLVACAAEPELATRVLTVINQTRLKLYVELEHRISPDTRPMKPLAFGYGNCPAVMLSPQMYRRVVLPADLWLRGRVDGLNLHHCGVFDEYIEVYRALSPSSLDIGGGSDYRAIRRAYPDTPFSLIVNAPDVESRAPGDIPPMIHGMAEAAAPLSLVSYLWVTELSDQVTDEQVRAVATAHEWRGERW